MASTVKNIDKMRGPVTSGHNHFLSLRMEWLELNRKQLWILLFRAGQCQADCETNSQGQNRDSDCPEFRLEFGTLSASYLEARFCNWGIRIFLSWQLMSQLHCQQIFKTPRVTYPDHCKNSYCRSALQARIAAESHSYRTVWEAHQRWVT